MNRKFKLNKAPYGENDCIMVTDHFDADKGGYFARVELINYSTSNGVPIIFKTYGPEFRNSGGDLEILEVGAKRKSKTRKKLAEEVISLKAKTYALSLASRLSDCFGETYEIIGEVAANA